MDGKSKLVNMVSNSWSFSESVQGDFGQERENSNTPIKNSLFKIIFEFYNAGLLWKGLLRTFTQHRIFQLFQLVVGESGQTRRRLWAFAGRFREAVGARRFGQRISWWPGSFSWTWSWMTRYGLGLSNGAFLLDLFPTIIKWIAFFWFSTVNSTEDFLVSFKIT